MQAGDHPKASVASTARRRHSASHVPRRRSLRLSARRRRRAHLQRLGGEREALHSEHWQAPHRHEGYHGQTLQEGEEVDKEVLPEDLSMPPPVHTTHQLDKYTHTYTHIHTHIHTHKHRHVHSYKNTNGICLEANQQTPAIQILFDLTIISRAGGAAST